MLKKVQILFILFISFFGCIPNQCEASKILCKYKNFRLYQIEKTDLDSEHLKTSMLNRFTKSLTQKYGLELFITDLLKAIKNTNSIFILAQDKDQKCIGWVVYEKIEKGVYAIRSKTSSSIFPNLLKKLLLSIRHILNDETIKIITEYSTEEEKNSLEKIGFKYDEEYSSYNPGSFSLITCSSSIVNKLNKAITPIHTFLLKEKQKRYYSTFNYINDVLPLTTDLEDIQNKIIEIKNKHLSDESSLQMINKLEQTLNECFSIVKQFSGCLRAKS